MRLGPTRETLFFFFFQEEKCLKTDALAKPLPQDALISGFWCKQRLVTSVATQVGILAVQVITRNQTVSKLSRQREKCEGLTALYSVVGQRVS